MPESGRVGAGRTVAFSVAWRAGGFESDTELLSLSGSAVVSHAFFVVSGFSEGLESFFFVVGSFFLVAGSFFPVVVSSEITEFGIF